MATKAAKVKMKAASTAVKGSGPEEVKTKSAHANDDSFDIVGSEEESFGRKKGLFDGLTGFGAASAKASAKAKARAAVEEEEPLDAWFGDWWGKRDQMASMLKHSIENFRPVQVVHLHVLNGDRF
jgi:hypothetical protein